MPIGFIVVNVLFTLFVLVAVTGALVRAILVSGREAPATSGPPLPAPTRGPVVGALTTA